MSSFTRVVFPAAIVGDITPHCGVSKEEKGRLETEAMATIREQLGGSSSIGKCSALRASSHRTQELFNYDSYDNPSFMDEPLFETNFI